MGQSISRRGFVSSMVGGALIAGFNPAARSWVTSARADEPFDPLPPLDGQLVLEGLDPFATDFGRIISRQPRAVLIPGSVNDVATMVRYARHHRLNIAANGQSGTNDMRESHSNYGQAQVQAGIVVDMKPLASISVQGDQALVGGGAHWAALIDATLPLGLTPPVLTDYVHLSVGGTLSVGGIGGATQHFGVQADNVLALEVVTGRGQRQLCSRDHNPLLFESVLAGAGQCGIIVGARVRLVPAQTQARVFNLFYDNLQLYLEDQRMLLRDGRFNYLEGQVVRRSDDTGWRFFIEAARYFGPQPLPSDAVLLAGLRDNRAEAVITDQSYRDFLFRLDPTVALLKTLGVWQLPHPWLTLFLPASTTGSYVAETLADLTLADTGQGPILLYPFDTRLTRRPLFRVPQQRQAFQLSILRTAPPVPEVIQAMLADNRTLYERAVAAGGTRYVIGAIPGFTPATWAAHFGVRWPLFLAAKQLFDPDRVLTPGQGMFPT